MVTLVPVVSPLIKRSSFEGVYVEYDAINKEVVLDNLNGIIKLVITYDAGLGEVTMEVIHPESVFLQVCNKMTHERKSLND